MESLTRLIRQHPFFDGFEPGHLELIVGCAANRRIARGAFLFREGGDAHEFYLLREGRIALECNTPHAGPVIFETIDGGEVIGWSWLVPPYKWMFDARVVADSRYIAFHVGCLRQKMESDTALGYLLMKRFMPVVVKRLQATRMSLMDIYARPGAATRGLHA